MCLHGTIKCGLGKLLLGAVVLEPILVFAVCERIGERSVLIIDGLLHGRTAESAVSSKLGR